LMSVVSHLQSRVGGQVAARQCYWDGEGKLRDGHGIGRDRSYNFYQSYGPGLMRGPLGGESPS
ncbi:MAG: hypothetical protein LC731_00100, partial [Acidobacteria bacterium]|nr:hypothetical protein [Acidobacteriota bacterium]